MMNRQKRNSTKVLLLLMAMVSLVACQQDDKTNVAVSPIDRKVPLQLSSGINTNMTRAYDSNWETGNSIGVFTTFAGTQTVTYSGEQHPDVNVRYNVTAAGSGYQTFVENDAPIYLPFDGRSVDVYAYYPWTSGVSDSSPLPVTLETTQTLTGQKGYDLLSACALSSTSAINLDYANVQLLFRHELSKVLIKVVAGEGYNSSDLLENIRVELTGQPTQALFSPLTRELAITTGSNTIVPMKLSSGDADYSKIGSASCIFRALVLPNMTETNPAVSSGQRQIRFYVGAEPNIATYKYNISQTFTAGQETTFTLRLAATGITITAAISAWDTESIDDDQPIYETN